MDDDKYKKLMRRFTITWWLLGIVLALFFLSKLFEPTPEIRHYVGEQGVQGQKGETGQQGEPGLMGEKGQTGTPGKDGQNTTIIIEKPAEKGDPGEPGKPGREVELQRNESGDIEWKYTNDRFWNVLISGCELTNTCGEEDGRGTNK